MEASTRRWLCLAVATLFFTAAGPAKADKPAPESSNALAWTVAAIGAAALSAGLVFNLAARSKMNDCRSLAQAMRTFEANDACNVAKPYARASYGLFGAAGLALGIDLILLLGSDAPVETVSLIPLQGGALASTSLRF